MKMKTRDENILIWKKPKFYSKLDQDAFLEWSKKIECIEAIKNAEQSIYLYIACKELHDHDLRDLLALFYRYKISMKQLRRYLTKQNKYWFYDNKIAYWHKKVFGKEGAF